jgi:PKD repeat protein
MAVSFTISPNKTGYAKSTKFSFFSDTTLNLLSQGYTAYLWNFGDGAYSREANPTHSYKKPGTYTVKFTAYKNDGTYDSYSDQISISLYLNESLYFDTVPPPTYAGHLNRYPFKIKITSSSTKPHYIDLGVQFSKSYQFKDPENKWSFLRPQWQFRDINNGSLINSIKTEDTLIRIDDTGQISPSGVVVGVTGVAEFYFFDDLYNSDLVVENQPYTTIIATLRTSGINSFHDSENLSEDAPSYSNSLASVTMPHIFNWRDPDFIRITENGYKKFSTVRFVNQKNPFVLNTSVNKIDTNDDVFDGNGSRIPDDKEFLHYVPYDKNIIFPLFNSNEVPINKNIVNLEKDENGNPKFLDVEITPSETTFKFEDDFGFKTGGYCKGSYVVKTSTIDCYLSASAYFPIPSIKTKDINPILWISNPEAGMMATAQYFYKPTTYIIDNGYLNKVFIKTFNVPIVEATDPDTFFTNDLYATSGHHGINCIAALPAPTYHAWAIDSDLNNLYRINSIGQILCSINLTNTYIQLRQDVNYNQVSPAYVVLDSKKNVWVSLYDTEYSLKFDNQGNYLTYAKFDYNIPTLDWWFHASSIKYKKLDSFGNPILDYDAIPVESTGIETDLNDNVWITYSSPFSGLLVKYNSNGNLLSAFTYPLCSCPQDLVCDNQNNIWVSVAENVDHLSGYIEKRNSNGVLLSSFGPFNSVNHMTLDNNQNLWFTYSYHWVGKIDNVNGRFSNIQIKTGNYSDTPPEWFTPNENADETALEGISSDYLGRIFVIHSIENTVFVIDSNTNEIVDRFYINPKGFVFSLSGAEAPTQVEYNIWSKSAQAAGDWSGFEWTNKYGSFEYENFPYIKDSTTIYKYVTGSSISPDNESVGNYLTYYPYNFYDLYKKNENFDLTESMKSISFQPSLQYSEFLYNKFFASIFGKEPFQHDDIGINIYEKIANFVFNKSDIDTCNVNALYDLAESVDLNTDDFRLNYPLSILRVMDLLSINQSRLFGTILQDTENFTTASKNSNFNRGNLLYTESYIVSAGTPVILKTKSLNNYRFINTGEIYNDQYYTLNILADSLSLPSDWEKYYEFYEYLPMKNEINVESIIDWEHTNFDRNETLDFLTNPSLSSNPYPDSFLKWTASEGTMESIFTYELYKGLGII